MNKKYNLLIKEEARMDIIDAYSWYEDKEVNLGEKFKRQLTRTFKYVQSNPLGFQVVFDNLRQATVAKFSYVVVFELFNTEIVVFAVFHTSQEPQKKRRKT